MPLIMVKAEERNLIERITGEGEVRRFLTSLEFMEGESIMVVSEIASNMILNTKGTRVTLDRSMADRITI